MPEQVMNQVKPGQLRYTVQTRSGLSAEEAELYLLAAVDEVCLACLLVQLSSASYGDPLESAPHTREDFAQYRRYVRVISISYRNPWEIVFEVLGSAGAVAAAITAMYNLRSARRKTDAETQKLLAEAKKLEAETRKLEREVEPAAAKDVIERRAYLEQTQEEIDLAVMILSRERQDRATREILAEVVLEGEFQYRIGYVESGLSLLRETLALSLTDVMNEVETSDAIVDSSARHILAREIADNTRLIASIRRLDEVERSAEALDADGQKQSSP